MATVYELFQRACRRKVSSLRGVAGDHLLADDGLSAVFAIEVRNYVISEVEYRATTCVTLVALCEQLVELAEGKRPEEAEAISPDALLDLHPEIPDSRRDRAKLVIQAFRSALTKVTRGAHS